MTRALPVLVVLGALDAACGGESPFGDGGFAVSVGALSLPDLSNARYTLRVLGNDDTEIWSSTTIDSERYGDGRGSIAYVAPCDSQLNPHRVELTLTDLWAGGTLVSAEDWVSPGPITREVVCVANGDTPVSFDLTVMRSANQGFFDTAVTFEDIFCSAKLDVVAGLLHDENGERGDTGVLGFACVAGLGQPTFLHMTDVRVVCDDGATTWVSPSGRDGQPGNMGPKPPSLFQTAVYWGHEDLVANADKCFWNITLGLGAFTGRCVLEGAATATDAPLVAGALPADAIYPYVKWSVPLTNESGAIQYGTHALSVAGSGVTAEYARGTGGRFESSLACVATPTIATPLRLTCDGRIGVVGSTEVVAVSQDIAGLSLIMGDARSPRYTLPAGFGVDACCLNPCCAE